MKPGIHPTWYPDARIVCACGNTWTTGSTKKETHIDVCNNCHPFFTGEQRIVDTAGQVERFMKRVSAKEKIAATLPPPEDKRAKKDQRDRKPPMTVETKVESPAQLPLAVVEEEKPVEPVAPELPVVETPAIEPIAELLSVETQPAVLPPALIETKSAVEIVQVAPARVEQMPIAAVEEPVAEMKPTRTRKVTAKKSAAKKPAAKSAKPRAKAAAKPKASVKKPSKPKTGAKKKK